METTMISHPKLRVGLRTGSEGPKHDPYHFEEFTIITSKGKTILHFGLGDWATHGKVQIELKGYTDSERVTFLREDFLREITGYTIIQLERIARKLKERCHECGGRRFESTPGFPGEYFTICSNCKNVIDSEFHISEIE